MKFSLEWLADFVTPTPRADELRERLTMAGLEVEDTAEVAATLSGVVVGKVLDVQPHAGADQLKVCTVDAGEANPRQIVCGAPNVRSGMRACLALPGAVLVGSRQVADSEIRGVLSQGMLCSAAEIALGDDDSGLLELESTAVPGTPLATLCCAEDSLFELSLTPNRGDCLSVLGIAREVAALQDLPLREPTPAPIPAGSPSTFPVTLRAPAQCPRYVGRIFEQVDAAQPTPLWMRERLRRSGVRSISLVVDITNYVMLAVGQPLHAFDLDTLRDGIVVRSAVADESLELLDGSRPVLDAGTLVIADGRGPLALAGIMGGRESGVTASTRRVFLESAWFDPVAIAGTARRLKLHTDASHRFERGVDPTGQMRAVEMASQLLVELAGAVPGPLVETATGEPWSPRVIPFRLTRANSLLGTAFSPGEAADIFRRLRFTVSSQHEIWHVSPPSERADVTREEDLVEELARLAGYANLPTTAPQPALSLRLPPAGTELPEHLRDTLATLGYNEAITYSFIAPDLWDLFADGVQPRALANPISSEMAVMRASLTPGLLAVLLHNQKRQSNDQAVFEVGLTFREDATALRQENHIAGVRMGSAQPEQWGSPGHAVDFFDMKRDVEHLLEACGVHGVSWEAAQIPGFHPGATARLQLGEQCLGVVGVVHPRVCRRLELASAPVAFELALNALQRAGQPAFQPFSRFPSVRRDLAVVLAEDVPAGAVLACVRRAGGELLRDLQLFDVYRGQGIDSGKKSLALGLHFQAPSSTLVDSQVDAIVAGIVTQLRAELGASLRV